MTERSMKRRRFLKVAASAATVAVSPGAIEKFLVSQYGVPGPHGTLALPGVGIFAPISAMRDRYWTPQRIASVWWVSDEDMNVETLRDWARDAVLQPDLPRKDGPQVTKV